MQRNRPTVEGCPLLQWHSGKTTAKRLADKRFNEGFVGFTVEAGRWEEFDRLADELAIERIEIKHRRPGGFEVKPHWSLGETLRVYPVTAGPIRATMLSAAKTPRESAERAAIVARWRDNRTVLALWVLPVICDLVHQMPLVLTVGSRMTDRLYAALLDHCTRVCDQAEALTGRSLMPWDLALPLTAGEPAEFGKADQTTVTPIESGHVTEALTNDDVAALGLPDGFEEYIEQTYASAVTWAIDEASREAEQATAEEVAQ